jgi:phospholipid-translocating ATPase
LKEGLSVSNTLWADTVLASKIAYGMAIYTGKETRMSMSKKKPSVKIGKTDIELNFISKLLFAYMVLLSVVLLLGKFL